MTLRSAAQTDIGLLRKRNEDRYLCDESLGLFGVADGIGGLPGGAEAAECTVASVRRSIAAESATSLNLAACVLAANHEVLKFGQTVSPSHGIGTTLSFGVLRGAALHIAHIGDSRCYLLRDGAFIQITSDHNVETEAKARIARGEYVLITERNRGALTRCVGQNGFIAPDTFSQAVLPGDLVLFCTDGLYRSITNEEFVEVLTNVSDLNTALTQLISLANIRGGHDNSTGVLLRIEE